MGGPERRRPRSGTRRSPGCSMNVNRGAGAPIVVVPADSVFLDRVLDEEHAKGHRGLSRTAYGRFDAAQMMSAWGRRHQRRFVLTNGDAVLASATQYQLTGALDHRPVRICGIGSVFAHAAVGCASDAEILVERLLDDAAQGGADMAVLLCDMDSAWCDRVGFERLVTTDVEVGIAQSPRHGAPMTLVRGGEERDLAAIVAMGESRAAPFRFHLDRDVDFVRHAITTKRLLAGFGPSGSRQLHFFIAEEGITAAAYVVVSVERCKWTIEECGDRDPSGARVGAILQGLIAREPIERRPVIRGWLPPGFAPPQVTILSAQASAEVVRVRLLGSTPATLRLTEDDVPAVARRCDLIVPRLAASRTSAYVIEASRTVHHWTASRGSRSEKGPAEMLRPGLGVPISSLLPVSLGVPSTCHPSRRRPASALPSSRRESRR